MLSQQSTAALERLAVDLATNDPSDRRTADLVDAIHELGRRARMTDLEKRVQAGEEFPTVDEVFAGLAAKQGFDLG